MLTVLCVLRSGGDFTPEYVRILRDGVARNLTIPYRFVCISDVDVPCERIPLEVDWPGWWSKIYMFKPGIITGPTIYLDLDTVIVGNIDAIAGVPYDFAMIDVKPKPNWQMGMSGALWFRKPQPHVYERFAEKPEYWINYHKVNAKDRYIGDQAFINDDFNRTPDKITDFLPGFMVSYKWKCKDRIPAGCRIVCFGGHPRPHEAEGWVIKAWK